MSLLRGVKCTDDAPGSAALSPGAAEANSYASSPAPALLKKSRRDTPLRLAVFCFFMRPLLYPERPWARRTPLPVRPDQRRGPTPRHIAGQPRSTGIYRAADGAGLNRISGGPSGRKRGETGKCDIQQGHGRPFHLTLVRERLAVAAAPMSRRALSSHSAFWEASSRPDSCTLRRADSK